MPETRLSEPDLQYYYTGLYRVLRHFRFMTLLGWMVVLAGAAGVPLGWDFGRWHGLIDLLLCVGTIIAGLALVQQSVVSLDVYVKVPFRSSPTGDGGRSDSLAIGEIVQLLKEIEEGGWQEAYAAIQKLRDIGTAHGLPPLE
jgi:hypothetical protein